MLATKQYSRLYHPLTHVRLDVGNYVSVVTIQCLPPTLSGCIQGALGMLKTKPLSLANDYATYQHLLGKACHLTPGLQSFRQTCRGLRIQQLEWRSYSGVH